MPIVQNNECYPASLPCLKGENNKKCKLKVVDRLFVNFVDEFVRYYRNIIH